MKRLHALLGIAALASLGLFANNAQAGPHDKGPHDTTDEILFLGSNPSHAGNGDIESNNHATVWAEAQNVTLQNDLHVNVLVSDLGEGSHKFDSKKDLNGGVISAGTAVSSFMLHVDPEGNKKQTFTGSITFSEPILGVVVENDELDASDSILGEDTDFGEDDSAIKLGKKSWFEISDDGKTISFHIEAKDDLGQIRIITEDGAQIVGVSLPTPTTAALGLVALGALAMKRERRLRH